MLAFPVLAQKGMHVGVNLGANSIWIFNQNNYGLSEMDYELKFGPNIGLAAGYNFTLNAGVQVELNYVSMGQNYYDVIRDFGPTDSTGKQQKVDTYRYIALKYLQIPVLFRYQTTKEKKDKIEFHAMVGPSIGLLLSANQYYEADIENNGVLVEIPTNLAPEAVVSAFAATPESEAAKDYFSSLDLGLHMDVGVDIYLSKTMYITPALKMYYGLTDLNSEPTRDTNEYGASHNGYAGISVGIHYISMEKK